MIHVLPWSYMYSSFTLGSTPSFADSPYHDLWPGKWEMYNRSRRTHSGAVSHGSLNQVAQKFW